MHVTLRLTLHLSVLVEQCGWFMKRVIYTSHLELRLALRSIPVDYPRAIYAEPDELYWDSIEGRSVAIRRLPFRSRIRPLMIAFDESSDAVSIVTIPPIAEDQILNTVKRGRWRKHG